ncbi:endonuclease [Chryseobacterium sp.]|uniref:endonuclease n=1 Tax=Chryseobacterium sp. TaxID=1871047 RepID=UPI0025BCE30D|nr:endonuclease [Chryseobacterium sp.]
MKRILFSLLAGVAFIHAYAQTGQLPAGYYDGTAGLNGAALKSKLNQIITNGHVQHTYADLWTAYQTTDVDNFYENDGTVLDIYSENPTGTDPYNYTFSVNQCGSVNGPEGTCYNREHIVPQSLFGEALPMKSDIHFIRATDYQVNGQRSNYPFGVVGTATFTSLNGSRLGNSASTGYAGTVFEPIDNFKGDIARMIFYFVTRYETQLTDFTSTNGTGNMLGITAYPGLQTWELNQLLAWNALDPVSAEEIARNNASFVYQGNRNPYIDNPLFVDEVWGNITLDTQAPTAATNLITTGTTYNSVSLSWTAATDNVGVAAYDVYANGTLKATVATTTATVTGLTPSTTYDFYVIAKDASGNLSPQSNIVTETTLNEPAGGSCGSENFETMPANANNYTTRTWTNNSITWTATSARTDETINNRAITIRNGELSSTSISGGIQSLTLTTQLKYTGTAGNLNVEINGNIVGTIPYSATVTTTTINNINVTGNYTIKIINPSSSNRVAMDDLSWSCNGVLGIAESAKDKSAFSIYPNPVRNNELFVKGENLSKISRAEIYDLSGKLIDIITKPFKNSNRINLKGLQRGIYILKTDETSTKFIVE